MKIIMKVLNKIILWTYDILENVSAVLIIGEMLAVTVGIIFRYFLNNSLSWVEELCVLSLIYLAYMTAGLATVSKTHIVADFISSKITGKPKAALSWVMRVLEIAFLALICHGVVRLLPNMTATSTALDIPRVWYYFPIGVMSVYIAFAILVDMLNELFPGFNYWKIREDERERLAAEAELKAIEESLAGVEKFMDEAEGESQ